MRARVLGLLAVLALFALSSCGTTLAADKQLYVTGDIVLGTQGSPDICVLRSRYAPGERVVWRADIIDPSTGKAVEDADVTVYVSNGQTFKMKYGPHGQTEPKPKFYTVGWTVPDNATPQTLSYSIEAKAGSKVGRFEPFKVAPSQLTIVAKK